MARKSRILALAEILKDEKALRQIGSKIVRAALADAARIGGAHLQNLDDPPWDDYWIDTDGPSNPWSNHWGDSGPLQPNWPDHQPNWDNAWNQGFGGDLNSMSVIAERAQPVFANTLSTDELKILKRLKIIE